MKITAQVAEKLDPDKLLKPVRFVQTQALIPTASLHKKRLFFIKELFSKCDQI